MAAEEWNVYLRDGEWPQSLTNKNGHTVHSLAAATSASRASEETVANSVRFHIFGLRFKRLVEIHTNIKLGAIYHTISYLS